MRKHPPVASSLLVLALAGCASTPPSEATAPAGASAPTAPTASTAAPPAAPDAPAATPTAVPPPTPAREPRSAATSLPAGLAPLDDAEKKELRERCAPFTRALEKLANAIPDERTVVDRVLSVLAMAPSVPQVDGPRCTALTRRDLLVYRARSLESEAYMGIKRIAVGLVSAATREPPSRCISAPPVPSDVRAVQLGPYTSKGPDWAPPGWRCVAFDMLTPQRFQYEMRVDASGGFEIIARGYPVDGSGPEELFLSGRIEAGMEGLSSDVMRR